MDRTFYMDLARQSMGREELENTVCERVLSDPGLEILPLLDAAYQVRKAFHGNKVRVHILNNAQNGHCPEDCHYCAQAKTSQANIEEYGIKPDAEIMEEARQAYAKGASCYCMVFAGRGASQSRIDRLTGVIGQIKKEFPGKEICVSTGFVTSDGAVQLKKAGLDRLNHNLNTSQQHYPNICTTHTFDDRLNTLLAARQAGIKLCSGMIVGMGEKNKDIIDVAKQLRALKAESIPVNLLVPIEGNQLSVDSGLTPEFCLRVLCLFRFLNPKAEIRAAAGRELQLRSMEVMALYPANSLFLQGYLNAKGAANDKTLRMIRDAGFEILSDVDIGPTIVSKP
ncbi:MAG: biotin synthase BioB, partial [Candidatus Omnitrophica bacterium]|nr:biotin synthase BioB [Candidatus Omnitrophota bacterium]